MANAPNYAYAIQHREAIKSAKCKCHYVIRSQYTQLPTFVIIIIWLFPFFSLLIKLRGESLRAHKMLQRDKRASNSNCERNKNLPNHKVVFLIWCRRREWVERRRPTATMNNGAPKSYVTRHDAYTINSTVQCSSTQSNPLPCRSRVGRPIECKVLSASVYLFDFLFTSFVRTHYAVCGR